VDRAWWDWLNIRHRFSKHWRDFFGQGLVDPRSMLLSAVTAVMTITVPVMTGGSIRLGGRELVASQFEAVWEFSDGQDEITGLDLLTQYPMPVCPRYLNPVWMRWCAWVFSWLRRDLATLY